MYQIFGLHRGKWKWVWTYRNPTPHELYCIGKYSQHPAYLVILGL